MSDDDKRMRDFINAYTDALTNELSKTAAYTPGQQMRVEQLRQEALANPDKFV